MLQEIQKLDYDRYISLIFTPKGKREDIISVVLFNLEIAKIKTRVTEPMMGHIRLQWWREALDEVFDSTRVHRKHEIVSKIKKLVGKYNLDKNDFLTIIDAREKDLDENPFETTEELVTYLTNTSYPVNKIILDILGVHDEKARAAVKHISLAWATVALLRGAHRNFTANRSVFPNDLMKKYNLNIGDFGKKHFPENAKPLVKELTETIAKQQLQSSQQIIYGMSYSERKAMKPVLLFSNIATYHITQIEKNDYDIFTRGLNTFLGIITLIKIYLL